MSSFLDSSGKLYMGFIFHVGLYSFYAFGDVKESEKQNFKNGSECYLNNLISDNGIKINKTCLNHSKYGSNFDYFRAPFHISREAVCNWLDLCVSCKATYAIITSKHYDGFCLWPTKTQNPKSRDDILQIFKEECSKRNLIFGIYYSWYEFMNPMTIEYFERTCIPQITELLHYGPQMFWFDGDWMIKQKTIIDYIRQIIFLIRNNNIIVNDRITKELAKELSSYKVGGLDKSTNRSFPSQYTHNWQHINTIGLSWGYNSMQEPKDYKNGLELMKLYQKTVSLGGNLLLNIGPKHDGSLDENELLSIQQFIEIIKELK
uniref:alpha-L-fucosidase n=1 Tax=viral metagenome TaxID=1070528 RepID=A0A6C0BC88_9ZZZZ